MAEMIYSLCTLTSLACAWLLFGGYRRTGHRILFWSGCCFGMLTLNNLLLIVDKVIFPEPEIDLLTLRLITALAALLLLVYGLIYEKE